MATRIRSFCKINLGLAVGPARPDGYHGLSTVYQTLALHDWVTVRAVPAASTRITLEADHPGVPCTASGNGERNTAYRVVASALERLRVSAAVEIRIEKRLPVQGGLGAGSANAAAALIALERELGRALPGAERLAMAAEVGSDVPFFLLGGTVLGLERGEAVYPLPDSPPLPVVVAVPEVGVSTAQAFRDLDAEMVNGAGAFQNGSLTAANPSNRLEQLSRVFSSVWATTGLKRVPTGIALAAQPSRWISDESSRLTGGDLAENPILALVHTGVENDFESVAFRQHSFLREIKQALMGSSGTDSRARYAALSGSGSALFGIYDSPTTAHEAQQRVQALQTRALVTETLPRQGYWDRMFA